jgi:hypothetical protein
MGIETMAQEVPTGTKDGLQAVEEQGGFWLSCFFLRNLPDGISAQQMSTWVSETFQKQCIRVAYADKNTRDKTRSGSYLIELSTPTARSIFSRQGRGEHFLFSIRVHCEEVRAEQFAKKVFSADPALTNQLPQDESSLAGRCLLLWQVSEDSFPLSTETVMQLFQGCLGEAVRQTATLSQNRQNDKDKFMVEFSSEESVGRILRAFDAKSSLLAIPVKLQAVKKRTEIFARKCLSEPERLQTDDIVTPNQTPERSEKKQGRRKKNRNSPTIHSPTIQSPTMQSPSGRSEHVSSEVDSPLPPPLFPDPIQLPSNHFPEPAFDFQALLPQDGEPPKLVSPEQLGLPLMLRSLLPPGTGPAIGPIPPLPSLVLPYTEEPLRTTPQDPACLLPLMLDSVSGEDDPVRPWGGLSIEKGIESMWNESFRRRNDDAVMSDLEEKLHATERENAAFREQAIKTERDLQKLRNELMEKTCLVADMREELKEKDRLLVQSKKEQD